jgi:hypothetical protein
VYRVQELYKVSTRGHRTEKQSLLKAVDKARRSLKANIEYEALLAPKSSAAAARAY